MEIFQKIILFRALGGDMWPLSNRAHLESIECSDAIRVKASAKHYALSQTSFTV